MTGLDGSSTVICPTCRDTHVIHTDRPGATSPRPCPSCSCTSCGTPSFNDERWRILVAAAEGRLDVNQHGRWVIEEDARPARKDREWLLHNGYITWPHYSTGATITPLGHEAVLRGRS